MFTTRTVVHQFINADGTPASGKVEFSLSGRMTNGGASILKTQDVVTTLDASGNLSLAVAANDDVGTLPGNTHWQVTIRVAGADVETYLIVVPSAGSGTVDLGTLLPNVEQVG